MGDELLRKALAQITGQSGRKAIAAVTFDDVAVGLLGPLAGRLCEQMGLPAICVSVAEGIARGSARSVPGFDIHSALKSSESLLTRFGGHARAAGFTTPASSLDEVLDAVSKQVEWELMGVEPHRELIIDYETNFAELPGSTWDFMRLLSPFGEANPEPVIVCRGLYAYNVRTVGAGGEHLRVDLGIRRLQVPGHRLSAGRCAVGQRAGRRRIHADRKCLARPPLQGTHPARHPAVGKTSGLNCAPTAVQPPGAFGAVPCPAWVWLMQACRRRPSLRTSS